MLGWSFFSQGTGERATSADQFIDHALRFFNDPDPKPKARPGQGRAARPSWPARTKRSWSSDRLSRYKTRFQGVKDPALERLIEELARDNYGPLCHHHARDSERARRFSGLDDGRIWSRFRPKRAGRCFASRACVARMRSWSRRARHSATMRLAINLLANWLRAIPGHPIAKAHEIPDLDIPPEKGRHPRRVMAAFAQRFGENSAEVEVLRLLGLFDRPATKGAIDCAEKAAARSPGLRSMSTGLDEAAGCGLLESCARTGLVAPASSHAPDEVDAHPLVREHFGAELREKHPEAWRAGHARLYEHFKALPEKQQPDTLEEMAPLFQAVFHGCQAGRHQEALDEVYWARIVRERAVLRHQKARRVRRRSGGAGRLLQSTVGKTVSSITEADQGFVVSPGRLSPARARAASGGGRADADVARKSSVAREDWKSAAVAPAISASCS